MKNRAVLSVCIVSIAVWFSVSVFAEETDRRSMEKATLAGLKGVKVAVWIQPSTKVANEADLKKTIELKLMKSGIKVLSESDPHANGDPVLYFTVNIVPGTGIAAIGANYGIVAAYLYDDAYLHRDNSKRIKAMLWRETILTQEHKESFNTALNKIVDRFTYDYLSVNMR